jgi:hypothetical protein
MRASRKSKIIICLKNLPTPHHFDRLIHHLKIVIIISSQKNRKPIID